MKLFLVLFTSLLISSGLQAQAQDISELVESEHFIVICEDAPICAPTATAADIAQRDAYAEAVAHEAEQILAWFKELGYPELELSTRHGKYLLIVSKDSICRDTTVIACHKGFSFASRAIFLPANMFMTGESDGNTLAHELSHALDIKPSLEPYGTDWLGEATAEAIGAAWDRHNGRPSNRADGFLKSLDLPFYMGIDGGYEKSDYFEMVGHEISSPDGVKYLGDFYSLSRSGNNGMEYLYTKVAGKTFAKMYPIYVARFNQIGPVIDGTPYRHYYNGFETKNVSINHASGSFTNDFDLNVPEYASDPVYFKTIKVAHGPEDEAKDLLMVAQFQIVSADDLEATQLVFEHRVAQNRQVRYLFSGLDPIDGGFVRVTNAAQNLDDNQAQNYRLELRADPVEFELPKCIAVNSSTDISLATGNLSGVDNWELRPSKGRVDGMTFTAPSTPGNVDIDLRITSPITRNEEGLQPLAPKVTTVHLGTIEVAREMCHIRMKITSGGDSITFTYAPSHDYSELLVPGGVKLYMSGSRIAMYDPASGWLPIPPGASAMMTGQIQGMMALATPPPWAQTEDLLLYRTPLMFSQWFDWRHVTDMFYPGVVKSRIGTHVDCPVSDRGCVSITAAGTTAIYNRHHQIEQLSQGADIATFEYGSFDVGYPPTW